MAGTFDYWAKVFCKYLVASHAPALDAFAPQKKAERGLQRKGPSSLDLDEISPVFWIEENELTGRRRPIPTANRLPGKKRFRPKKPGFLDGAHDGASPQLTLITRRPPDPSAKEPHENREPCRVARFLYTQTPDAPGMRSDGRVEGAAGVFSRAVGGPRPRPRSYLADSKRNERREKGSPSSV